LQRKLFEQFRILNARGEVKDLCELFAPTYQGAPPAGAGECAAPKLLQYTYQHQLEPIAMAEFWWGRFSQDGDPAPWILLSGLQRKMRADPPSYATGIAGR